MITSNIALKEWAIVTEAMAEGRQLLILRKGGIRDQQGAFQLKHREFFLYPTWEHQSEETEAMIRPEFRERYRLLLASPKPAQTVPLKIYAGVATCGPIRDPEQMAGLEKYHLWTPEFIQGRMKYRPQAPTLVVVLRVYRLPKEIEHPVRPEYAGCKSWVTLAESIPVEGAVPVMENQHFRQALEAIHSRLEK